MTEMTDKLTEVSGMTGISITSVENSSATFPIEVTIGDTAHLLNIPYYASIDDDCLGRSTMIYRITFSKPLNIKKIVPKDNYQDIFTN